MEDGDGSRPVVTVMSSPLKQLITPDELAATWRVSRNHIYDLMRRERNPLPGTRIGRRISIDPAAAAAWLEAEQKGAA